MPRPAEPPRLYLRKDGDRNVWIIRDRDHDERTGCAEGERDRAETRLAEYLAKKHTSKPAKGGKSDSVSLAEVMRVYVMERAPMTADLADNMAPARLGAISDSLVSRYVRARASLTLPTKD